MSNIIPFQTFLRDLGEKIHDLSSDTFKARLITAAVDPSWDTWSDCSAFEIANGNGYTTGGVTLTIVSYSIAGGAVRWIIDSPVWTSSGTGMASYRSVIVLNDTAASDQLALYIDYGYGRAVASGQAAPIFFDEENGAFIIGLTTD